MRSIAMKVRAATLACFTLAGVTAATASATPPDGIIAADVSIDGIPVGGNTADAARRAVLSQRVAPRIQPLVLSLRGRRMSIKPQAVGYAADVDAAVAEALTYGRTVPIAGPVNVALPQEVDRARLRDVLAFRAKDIEVAAIDAKLTFRNGKPKVRKPRIGTAVDVVTSVPLVADAILLRNVPQVDLPSKRVRPARTTVGPSIVIARSDRVLTLYREQRKVKTFRVAVGTSQHPTPRGLFSVIQKQRNPAWNPPDSPWAAGLGPIPPGPGNPLGTRWIGTSASAVGIHGTYATSSIGTAASHGCIRMYIRDVEWLYERVQLGTPVLIR
jgi:lipoprotein-anchoring transpeptidase ErfK/SrfK